MHEVLPHQFDSPKGGLSPDFNLGVSLAIAIASIGELELPLAVQKANELQAASTIDVKTNLLTQQAWLDNFRHAMEDLQTDDTMTVYVSDLNGFKAVNDELGHDAGDELLGIVGLAYMQTFKRSSDVATHGSREEKNDSIARLGGDEFAVYVAKKAGDNAQRTTSSAEEVQLQPDRVNRELEHLLEDTKFEKFGISLSIGTAEYQLGDTAEIMFAKADLEMFRVKYQGKIENLTPEDLDQLNLIVPFLEKIGHRVEAWAKMAINQVNPAA